MNARFVVTVADALGTSELASYKRRDAAERFIDRVRSSYPASAALTVAEVSK